MIPKDIQQLMARQSGQVTRGNLASVASELARLGVNEKSELGQFFREYQVSTVSSSTSSEELMDLLSPSQQVGDVTEFARDAYDLAEGYLALTSGEGEGFYLYGVEGGEVFDLGVDELDALEAGQAQPRWSTFFDFLRWFLEAENVPGL